jgi:hypothetical protein
VQQVKEMNGVTAKGSIFASAHFATLLALEGKMFVIDYGGIFILPSDQQKMFIFKITFTNKQG